MGKKKDKKQKGKGAEKTALKTERKADKKSKKLLKEKGEVDVEALVAGFQENDQKLQKVEEKCDIPSPRSNMTLTAHPHKDELVMFGGEYFNGNKTFMYNELYFYNIKNNTWSTLQTSSPPPRCSHQAVAVRQDGGQLWIFGGEFASPSQSQFYHYKDLWVYNFTEKQWEQISAPNGPSARSGHRMVACKKQIIVFGGFHDNTREYKYFNDVHAFNLDTYTWCLIETIGSQPLPRSACVMAATQDHNHIVIYGGYSKEKIKKDVDKGNIHVDMFRLSPEGKDKGDKTPAQWKWMPVKQSGVRPSPRCGCTLVATPGNRAIVFGGVFDEEEDEEVLKGTFYNDMYSLELDKGKWHEVYLKGKKEHQEKRKRRSKKAKLDIGDNEETSDSSDLDMEQEVENLQVAENKTEFQETQSIPSGQDQQVGTSAVTFDPQNSNQAFDPSIFSVTIGSKADNNKSHNTGSSLNQAVTSDSLFWPCKRINTMLAVKNGILYLYGGMTEDGDKQLTFSDFYTLDLHKLDEWNTIVENDVDKLEWEESSDDSEDSDSEEDVEGASARKRKHSDDSDLSSSEDSDEDMDLGDAPDIKEGESAKDYFSRTRDYWMLAADDVAEKEKLDVTTKQLKKAAFKMAEEHMSKQK